MGKHLKQGAFVLNNFINNSTDIPSQKETFNTFVYMDFLNVIVIHITITNSLFFTWVFSSLGVQE